MNSNTLLAIILALLLLPIGARAQDGRHGIGHVENHDSYRTLVNPSTGTSCCHAQSADDPNGDCRPGAVWRDAHDNLRARIGGQDVYVPESALVPRTINPHPPVGMICERAGNFYCVALSDAGG